MQYILGGMLSRCTFNGQQCCHQFVIDQFDGAMRLAINSGKIQFTRSFADAQKAVDEMRKDATGIYNYKCIILAMHLMHLATIKYLLHKYA